MADICYFEMKDVGEPVNLWEMIDLMNREGAYQKSGIRWINFDNEPCVSDEN